ncbi:hypothetical protein PR202_ga29907 [Eleusine coracana subsp. coracana]|uniref:Uncharacterized protein n=1 Tax=Eleusine coracana subsp. coracana TaxID=191504 RepID=A0AAV5DNJ7_ELECO|nr:hypothetical protein PR202_ga29907 [Eleusine coracana subsp. coracana]
MAVRRTPNPVKSWRYLHGEGARVECRGVNCPPVQGIAPWFTVELMQSRDGAGVELPPTRKTSFDMPFSAREWVGSVAKTPGEPLAAPSSRARASAACNGRSSSSSEGWLQWRPVAVQWRKREEGRGRVRPGMVFIGNWRQPYTANMKNGQLAGGHMARDA